MHRPLIAVFVATGLMVVASTMAAGAAPDGGGCVEPVPQRNYGPDRVIYAMVIDLGDCDWWDGGEVVARGDTVAPRRPWRDGGQPVRPLRRPPSTVT